MTINILHTTHFAIDQGGAEKQLHLLANYYATQGHIVSFICPARRRKEVSVSYHLYCMNLYKFTRLKRLGNLIHSFRMLLRTGHREVDVYITRSDTVIYRVVFWYTFILRKPHIHYLASDNDLDLTVKLGWLFRYFKAPLQRKKVVCQNDIQLRHNRKSLVRIEKISQLIELTKDTIIVEKAAMLLKVVFVGNLKPIKRPDLLIMIAEFLEKKAGFELNVIGRCPNARIKDKLLGFKNTNYLGELSNSETLSVLGKSHVLLNLSDFEGFSNTFLEAWLMGCLVISRNSNPDGVIDRFNLGYVVRDTQEILERLNSLRLSKSLNNRGAVCRSYVLNNHTVTSKGSLLNSLLDI